MSTLFPFYVHIMCMYTRTPAQKEAGRGKIYPTGTKANLAKVGTLTGSPSGHLEMSLP